MEGQEVSQSPDGMPSGVSQNPVEKCVFQQEVCGKPMVLAVPQHSCNGGQMVLKASSHAVSRHGQKPLLKTAPVVIESQGLVFRVPGPSETLVFERIGRGQS